AATALYQEVQMLNRYVRDAALREGYATYVVRLQISLMPRARFVPYDAYSTISFFNAGQDGAPQTFSMRGDEEQESGAANSNGGGTDTGKKTKRPPASSAPIVIPLLVTDNLEASVQSRNEEQAQKLSLELSKLGVFGADVDNALSRIESALGSDLNSLFTIGRVTENTLRVRLGAMNQGSTRWGMVPRTHTVTVMVVVPTQAKLVQIATRTTMVDVVTGETLQARGAARVDELLNGVIESYELTGSVDTAFMQRLLGLAQRNEQDAFVRVLAERVGDDHSAVAHVQSLWVDLVELVAGGQYATALLDLRNTEPRGTRLFPKYQTPEAVDDGKTTTVTLVGGEEIRARNVVATLQIETARGRIGLVGAVSVNAKGTEATLEFPSLAAWGVADVGKLSIRLRAGSTTAKYNVGRYRKTAE
ncbi:MAG: hypothetical protein OER88_01315, partial [Planctomycetota bacterium]|nr:hypothetical protein [Planctomycetota bacterium]